MPDHVEQQLALGPVQDLHQVPDGLLPDVQRVLARRARADVLAVAGEAALLPGRSGNGKVTGQSLKTYLVARFGS